MREIGCAARYGTVRDNGTHPSADNAPCSAGSCINQGAARVTTPIASTSPAAKCRSGGRCKTPATRWPDQVKGSITGKVPSPNASMVNAPLRALACSQATPSRLKLNPHGSQPHNRPSSTRRGAVLAGSRRDCNGRSHDHKCAPGPGSVLTDQAQREDDQRQSDQQAQGESEPGQAQYGQQAMADAADNAACQGIAADTAKIGLQRRGPRSAAWRQRGKPGRNPATHRRTMQPAHQPAEKGGGEDQPVNRHRSVLPLIPSPSGRGCPEGAGEGAPAQQERKLLIFAGWTVALFQ